MRLLYVAQHHPRPADGVTRKLLAQVATWRRLGHDVKLLIVSPSPDVEALVPPDVGTVIPYRGAWGVLRATRDAVKTARGGRWDAVYLRFTRPWPAFRRLANTMPVFVELNGSEPVLGRQGLPAPMRQLATWPAWRFLRTAQGVFTVSHHVNASLLGRGVRADVVPNGADLERVPPGRATALPGRIVFAGSGPFAWNGLDKLLPALELFPWLHLDIIGKDVAPVGLATHPRVRVHGPLQDDAYFNVLQTAAVGIGPLALHRRGLRDTSSLKLGEYLAAGLAVITGHDDPLTAWMDQLDAVCSLPNDETNVSDHLATIGAFVQRWSTTRPSPALRAQVAMDRLEQHRLDLIVQWLRSPI